MIPAGGDIHRQGCEKQEEESVRGRPEREIEKAMDHDAENARHGTDRFNPLKSLKLRNET